MSTDFEKVTSALIKVDPYRRSQRNKGSTKNANVSVIDYTAGRGSSGVHLRWYHPTEFKALTNEQRDELREWNHSQEGKKVLDKSRKAMENRKRKADDDKSKSQGSGSWKKKLKK